MTRELGPDSARVNVNDGALGHRLRFPARILVQHLERGIATVCIGGGMGIAQAAEND